MGNWRNSIGELGPAMLEIAVGLGFAVAFLGGLSTGLGATAAGNIVSNIIGYVNTNVTNYLPLVILAVLIGVAYGAASIFMKGGKGKK